MSATAYRCRLWHGTTFAVKTCSCRDASLFSPLSPLLQLGRDLHLHRLTQFVSLIQLLSSADGKYYYKGICRRNRGLFTTADDSQHRPPRQHLNAVPDSDLIAAWLVQLPAAPHPKRAMLVLFRIISHLAAHLCPTVAVRPVLRDPSKHLKGARVCIPGHTILHNSEQWEWLIYRRMVPGFVQMCIPPHAFTFYEYYENMPITLPLPRTTLALVAQGQSSAGPV